MKKLSLVMLSIVLSIFLMGCNLSDENQTEATFTGTITDITEQSALVDIEEGEILNSGAQVMVDLSTVDETFEVGDNIRVGYEGGVMESHPLQINTVFVEKLEE